MSQVYRHGMAPDTRSIVSSKNRIYAPLAGGKDLVQIGVMSSFSMNESRNVEAIRGIGYGDMIAELVPGNTEPMSISVARTALYLTNIFQVFGYNAGVAGLVRSLRHHKFPFDIKQEIIFSNFDTEASKPPATTDDASKETPATTTNFKSLITFFEGCWMTSYSTDFSSDTALVQEQVEIIVTDVNDGSSIYESGTSTGLSGDTSYFSKIWGS